MPLSPTERVARAIVQTLHDAGFVAYFAGGWVRDHLLSIPSADIDIATNAPPAAVMQLFPKTISVGLAFGSVVVVQEGLNFEVTTFRSEGSYSDGRRPDSITYSSAREDAERRSFTINGMFYDPIAEEVLDFVGGRNDLASGLIRAIGNADERFKEDKLRMMRAVRFAVRLKFVIEPKTRQAIIDNAAQLLPAVAIERVWQEFEKVKRNDLFAEYINELQELGLLAQIFPQLSDRHVDTTPIARFPEGTPSILKVMHLFKDADLLLRLSICERLKVSSRDRDLVMLQAELQRLIRQKAVSRAEWAHFYTSPSSDLLLEVAAYTLPEGESFLAEHRDRMHQLAPHIARLRLRQPLVDAATLRQLGVAPGKQMGLLLKEAERIAIDEDLHDRAAVLTRLRESTLFQAHHQ